MEFGDLEKAESGDGEEAAVSGILQRRKKKQRKIAKARVFLGFLSSISIIFKKKKNK